MKVCTSEEAAAFNCYSMPKKCCGAQCMAWNELGENGFCGAIPQPEIMQHAVESFGGVPLFEPYPLNTEHPPKEYEVLKVVGVSPLLDHVSIDTLNDGSPEHFAVQSSPQAGDVTSHTIPLQPALKHNKHKGNR